MARALRTAAAVAGVTCRVLISLAAVATVLNLLSPLFNWPRNGGPAW